MKRRIKRIAPLQAGKILGVLYGGLGLLALPFFLFAGALSALAQNASHQTSSAVPAAAVGGLMIGLGIFIPVIYGVMGFFFGVIGAALYNLIARWIGGFEVEIEEVA